jgi:hypothetical protein
MSKSKNSLYDVYLGRGNGVTKMQGTCIYRQTVKSNMKEYQACKGNMAKARIAHGIMVSVQSKGGTFFYKPDSIQGWIIAPESEVLEKIKQALRERRCSSIAKFKRLVKGKKKMKTKPKVDCTDNRICKDNDETPTASTTINGDPFESAVSSLPNLISGSLTTSCSGFLRSSSSYTADSLRDSNTSCLESDVLKNSLPIYKKSSSDSSTKYESVCLPVSSSTSASYLTDVFEPTVISDQLFNQVISHKDHIKTEDSTIQSNSRQLRNEKKTHKVNIANVDSFFFSEQDTVKCSSAKSFHVSDIDCNQQKLPLRPNDYNSEDIVPPEQPQMFIGMPTRESSLFKSKDSSIQLFDNETFDPTLRNTSQYNTNDSKDENTTANKVDTEDTTSSNGRPFNFGELIRDSSLRMKNDISMRSLLIKSVETIQEKASDANESDEFNLDDNLPAAQPIFLKEFRNSSLCQTKDSSMLSCFAKSIGTIEINEDEIQDSFGTMNLKNYEIDE